MSFLPSTEPEIQMRCAKTFEGNRADIGSGQAAILSFFFNLIKASAHIIQNVKGMSMLSQEAV